MDSSHRLWILGLTCLLALALAALGAQMAQAAKPIITTPTPTPAVSDQPGGLPARNLYGTGLGPARQPDTSDWPIAVAGLLPADGNPDVFTYTVRSGDTLLSLAIDFGRDLDTMACATRPKGDDAATLFLGQVITVPALTDQCYTVTPGDTLSGIAASHGLSVDQITSIAWNDLPKTPPFNIVPRQRILLRGARPSPRARPDRDTIRNAISVPNDGWAISPWPQWPYGDGHFIWPVEGPISQYFRIGHRAIDIAVPERTPVRAADRGTVMMAGWSNTGYGFRVVVDHHIDYLTLYAHMSDIYVEEGQIVAKGQIIGVTGANGNVTGPHLHFEIRDFGILTDPLTLLPGNTAPAMAGPPITGPLITAPKITSPVITEPTSTAPKATAPALTAPKNAAPVITAPQTTTP